MAATSKMQLVASRYAISRDGSARSVTHQLGALGTPGALCAAFAGDGRDGTGDAGPTLAGPDGAAALAATSSRVPSLFSSSSVTVPLPARRLRFAPRGFPRGSLYARSARSLRGAGLRGDDLDLDATVL